MGLNTACRQGVFTAQNSNGAAGGNAGRHRLAHPLCHEIRAAHVRVQGRRGVDAQRGNIKVKLRVIVLHLAGGGYDGCRTVTRTATVGGGAVVGNRNQDHPGGLQSGLLRGQSEKARINPRNISLLTLP